MFFEQVSFVQYSDDAKTEFKLNTYHDKGVALSALQSVRYRGGNTKTGTPRSVGTSNSTSPSRLVCSLMSRSLWSLFFTQALLWSMSMRRCSPQTAAWGGTSPRCWWWSQTDAPRMTSRRAQRNCSMQVCVELFIIIFVCVLFWVWVTYVQYHTTKIHILVELFAHTRCGRFIKLLLKTASGYWK